MIEFTKNYLKFDTVSSVLMACMVMGTRQQRLAATLNRAARRKKMAQTDGMGPYPTTCRAAR